MKNRALFFTILSFVIASFLISSCSKDDDDDDDEEENTAVVAKFSMEGTNQEAPADVKFNNKSENAVSYLWDFGDGETSTEENPTHTYAEKGEYEVNLVAEGEDGSTDDFGMYFDIFGTVTGMKIRRVELHSDFLAEISDPEGDAMDVGIAISDASGNVVYLSYYWENKFSEAGEEAVYGPQEGEDWVLDLDGTYTLLVLEYDLTTLQGTPTGDEVTISVPDIVPSNDDESYPDEITFDDGNLIIDLNWENE